METEILNWPSTFVKVAPILGPALITALLAYAIARLQLRIKEREIRGQTQLRARELFYNSYQQQLDRLFSNFQNFDNSMGKLLATLITAETEDEKNEILRSVIELFEMNVRNRDDSIMQLIEELRVQNLLDERRQKHIEFITETMNLEFKNLNAQDADNLLQRFLKMSSLIYGLESDLVEKKRDALFEIYLK